MAAIVKSFIVILLLGLISKGFCSCSLDSINIGTYRSGREIAGKPEWNVVVTNNCKCPQKFIKLSCPGFQTVEPINPSILLKQGDKCLLINGNALAAGDSVKFSYAWGPPFLLLPAVSEPWMLREGVLSACAFKVLNKSLEF